MSWYRIIGGLELFGFFYVFSVFIIKRVLINYLMIKWFDNFSFVFEEGLREGVRDVFCGVD